MQATDHVPPILGRTSLRAQSRQDFSPGTEQDTRRLEEYDSAGRIMSKHAIWRMSMRLRNALISA